jgi:hypothetical protein
VSNRSMPEWDKRNIDPSGGEEPRRRNQQEPPASDDQTVPTGPPLGLLHSPVCDEDRPIYDLFGLGG